MDFPKRILQIFKVKSVGSPEPLGVAVSFLVEGEDDIHEFTMGFGEAEELFAGLQDLLATN